MKTRLLPKVSLVLILAVLSLAGCMKQPGPTEQTAALESTDSDLAMEQPDESPMLNQLAADEGDISDAEVKPAGIPNTVTAPVQLNSVLSEMIRIAQSGVDENVLIAYVTNSSSSFNAGPEEIIYLNDIGIAPEVVTAMIVHDRELREAVTSVATIPTAPSPAGYSTVSYSTPPPSPTMVDPAFSRSDGGTETYAAPAQPADVSNDDFYGSLAPYGNWVDVSGYGRCWQPTVVALNPDWRPYCDGGRWVYSDCGWYWLSDYSWGWAPFHYGRWFRHTQLGWCWVPDTTWGPSWVSWRYGDDYCGWAPLPPWARFRPGLGFSYAGHVVAGSFDFGLNASCFTFVPFSHFRDHRLSHHVLARNKVDSVFHRTVVSTRVDVHNHIVINNGLPADRVVNATHTELHPVAVRQFRGSAARGLRAEHLESGGTVLTVERPSRTNPTQTLRHPPGSPPAAQNRGGLQVNAHETPAASSQMISRPERSRSGAGNRLDNNHVATAPQPVGGSTVDVSSVGRLTWPGQTSSSAATETQGSGNSRHTVVIRSYPSSATEPAQQSFSDVNAQPPMQNPAWLQSPGHFDNRRQQPGFQRAPSAEPRVANSWNPNADTEPAALVQRRNGAQPQAARTDPVRSFTPPQYTLNNTVEQVNPRSNYQPPQFLQPAEPRFEPRTHNSEARIQANETRSANYGNSELRSSHVESARPAPAPAPAPAPVTHDRSSSNDRSSDRQERQSSGRSR